MAKAKISPNGGYPPKINNNMGVTTFKTIEKIANEYISLYFFANMYTDIIMLYKEKSNATRDELDEITIKEKFWLKITPPKKDSIKIIDIINDKIIKNFTGLEISVSTGVSLFSFLFPTFILLPQFEQKVAFSFNLFPHLEQNFIFSFSCLK